MSLLYYPLGLPGNGSYQCSSVILGDKSAENADTVGMVFDGTKCSNNSVWVRGYPLADS